MTEQNQKNVNDVKDDQPNTEQRPFFARFIEGQGVPNVRSDVRAGKPNQTMKYPSDGDEW
ncbi:MAG: microviridin/marinostatin family tricyclic proteinase inhibitor [Phycisphaerales bacterium]|nr:microviridin/marinostatin family tricyclic proteinase inhibitor [Phycisphaerales bacterium]